MEHTSAFWPWYFSSLTPAPPCSSPSPPPISVSLGYWPVSSLTLLLADSNITTIRCLCLHTCVYMNQFLNLCTALSAFIGMGNLLKMLLYSTLICFMYHSLGTYLLYESICKQQRLSRTRGDDCKSQNLRAMPDNNMQFRTMPENNRSGDNNSVAVKHSSLEHIFLKWSVTICLGKAGEKMQLLFCHCQNKSCFAIQLTLGSLQYLQILKKICLFIHKMWLLDFRHSKIESPRTQHTVPLRSEDIL